MRDLLRIGGLLGVLLLSHTLAYRIGAEGTPTARAAQKVREISEYQWVDKQCRIFSNDKIGIDVDQTCLEVRTIIGGIVVIPNPHNDFWAQEVVSEMKKPQAKRDKWLVRFYELGGGKPSKE